MINRQYQTLSYTNQFRFVCPVFDTEVGLSGCNQLRDKHWRGEDVMVRAGCRCAMRSGKCPATAIIDRIIYGRDQAPDSYSALTPTVGKLRQDVLNKIRPVIVQEGDMRRYEISEAERSLLMTADARIDAQLKTAPSPENEEKTYIRRSEISSAPRKPRKQAEKPTPAPTTNATLEAARTGDLTAAINEATK